MTDPRNPYDDLHPCEFGRRLPLSPFLEPAKLSRWERALVRAVAEHIEKELAKPPRIGIIRRILNARKASSWPTAT